MLGHPVASLPKFSKKSPVALRAPPASTSLRPVCRERTVPPRVRTAAVSAVVAGFRLGILKD